MRVLETTRQSNTKQQRLGEELPIFCEKCGYSLHGLSPINCAHCTILQFHCPECGHHQPINTLRPAFQTMLGRVRGAWLVGVIAMKLAFFIIMLISWTAMGTNWSYQWNPNSYVQNSNNNGYTRTGPSLLPIELSWGAILGFVLLGVLYGMVGRMMLLRWRRGAIVGLIIALLALAAMVLGARMRRVGFGEELPSPFQKDFLVLLAIGAASIIAASSLVWPLWVLLVRAFLPTRTANLLLEWQKSLSNRVSALARADGSVSSSSIPRSAPEIRVESLPVRAD